MSRRQPAQQFLGEVHKVDVVRVCLVELDGRELRVVAGRQALVAEAAVDLVYALEAADHQPLQVQLRRDAQVEIGIQCVVVRHERPGGRTAGDRVHHRRLDFEVSPFVEEAAHGRHEPGPGAKHLARLLVHHEIQVSLPIAEFPVGEAVVFVRQGLKRLDEQPDLAGMDGEFAGIGFHQGAADSGNVAEVPEVPEVRIGVLADVVPADIALDPSAWVFQGDETRFAHDATQHHAPGHGGRDPGLGKGFLGHASVAVREVDR